MTLWLLFAGCCALLLRLFWLPSTTWAMLLLSVLMILFYRLMRRVRVGPSFITIDENGAFWQQGSKVYAMDFVRVNGVQIIAKVMREGGWLGRIWPSYQVIYRDSLSYHDYRVLRSFAAQQKMLKRSEVTSKH